MTEDGFVKEKTAKTKAEALKSRIRHYAFTAKEIKPEVVEAAEELIREAQKQMPGSRDLLQIQTE